MERILSYCAACWKVLRFWWAWPFYAAFVFIVDGILGMMMDRKPISEIAIWAYDKTAHFFDLPYGKVAFFIFAVVAFHKAVRHLMDLEEGTRMANLAALAKQEEVRQEYARDMRAEIIRWMKSAAVLPNLYAHHHHISSHIKSMQEVLDAVRISQNAHNGIINRAVAGHFNERLSGDFNNLHRPIQSIDHHLKAAKRDKDFGEAFSEAKPKWRRSNPEHPTQPVNPDENPKFIRDLRHDAKEIERMIEMIDAAIAERRSELNDLDTDIRRELERLKNDSQYTA